MTTPPVPPQATDRELLDQAEATLHGVALDLIARKHLLDKPFTDRPDLSPWTRTTGKVAHAAHDLHRAIRQHLGLPYRHGYKGLGFPALELEQVIDEAVQAERERIATDVRAQFGPPRGHGAFLDGWNTAVSEFLALLADPAHKLRLPDDLVRVARAGRQAETPRDFYDDGVHAERERWRSAVTRRRDELADHARQAPALPVMSAMLAAKAAVLSELLGLVTDSD